MNRTRHRAVAALVAGVCLAAVAVVSIPASAAPIGSECARLHIFGVQGTGQSSPTADPSTDSGVVGALIAPVLAAAPGLVTRSYIPYSAGFGGAVPGGGAAPYTVSVAEARNRLDTAVTQLADTCPETAIAAVGYSQGAQAVSWFARDIGAGSGPVPAEQIAGIALYANPDRTHSSPVLPGRPGQSSPDPAPGTSGEAVAGVQMSAPVAPGSGIAERGTGYGTLTGRVADFCAERDLACSAPDRAALLRLGAEIAARADLRDPLAAVNSLAALLSAALGDAWTTVLLNDFHLTPGRVDYQPTVPLAQRLIDAADPRLPTPGPAEHTAASARWNAITATVATNPLNVVPALVGQLGAAWGQLLADNAALLDPAVWVRFAGTVAAHTDYATGGLLVSGAAWMTALAHDLAGGSF
ncbi:cutinase family protein [Nocardia sienata]|uniref:cutinase family protein n=1 Tax=Nocardia sienata TaxID=248552 RepID=UPI001FE1172A|nr:cutinase family protein [Nocardia sienata]